MKNLEYHVDLIRDEYKILDRIMSVAGSRAHQRVRDMSFFVRVRASPYWTLFPQSTP